MEGGLKIKIWKLVLNSQLKCATSSSCHILKDRSEYAKAFLFSFKILKKEIQIVLDPLKIKGTVGNILHIRRYLLSPRAID
jgi:hypothetical protein